jgi:hypothetical protein
VSTSLTRRTLLVGSVLVAGGGAWWVFNRPRPLSESELAILRLAEGFDLPAAGESQLGLRYLELHRDEADAEELISLVFQDAVGGDPEDLRALLSEGVERDWSRLDTVQLDGWILSRTEGRYLALSALLEERRPQIETAAD